MHRPEVDIKKGCDAHDVATARTRRVEGSRARGESRTESPWYVDLHDERNSINRVVWRLWRTIPGMTVKITTRIT